MPWGRGPWSRTEPPRGREPESPAAPSPAQLRAARSAWQQAPAMTDRVLRQWWGNMRMRWNCHSTAIEGSPLSYQDTLDVLVHAQAPQGQPPLLDIDQIRGHDAAAQQLAHMLNQGQDLQLADLHEIHRTMLVRPYPARNLRGDPVGARVRLGAFKGAPNALISRGTVVEFAAPAQVPQLMTTWWDSLTQRVDILRQEPGALDPAGVLAATHWDFIAIHPYDDGNGRMARWVTNYMAMAIGYAPLVIRLDQKDAYFQCFRGMSRSPLPATPADYQLLRDFLAGCMQDSVEFAGAVARGETDPSWHNEQADLARPLAARTYPADPRVPYLRAQDRRSQPDGTAL